MITAARKNCGTCCHAPDFRLTPTGRFKKYTTSRCTFAVTLPILPVCASLHERRSYVQPDMGSDCQTWEEKP
jgi:hypothetical protein